MKIVRLLTLCVLLLLPVIGSAESLVLARAPQLSPALISQIWSPFVKSLSESSSVDISLKVYTDRAMFEKDIVSGKVDLYFGNPGYGVVGYLKHGYIPLIRSNRKLLEGIIVVKKDSKIKQVEQLNGKVIAFPSRTAFAASLYLRSHIDSNFKINYQPVYAGSHDNTYRSVLVGKALGGGGVKRTLERESDALKNQLRIIYVTPGIKSHPLMIHPRIPEASRKAIQKAVLDMNGNEAGRKMLKKVKLQKPVAADYDADYKEIEKLSASMYRYLLE